MTNSDKHNNLFCACAIAKLSEKAENTKRNITQTSKETIGEVSTNRLLDIWETLFSFSKYILSSSFCSVAFSLLFDILSRVDCFQIFITP